MSEGEVIVLGFERNSRTGKHLDCDSCGRDIIDDGKHRLDMERVDLKICPFCYSLMEVAHIGYGM